MREKRVAVPRAATVQACKPTRGSMITNSSSFAVHGPWLSVHHSQMIWGCQISPATARQQRLCRWERRFADYGNRSRSRRSVLHSWRRLIGATWGVLSEATTMSRF